MALVEEPGLERLGREVRTSHDEIASGRGLQVVHCAGAAILIAWPESDAPTTEVRVASSTTGGSPSTTEASATSADVLPTVSELYPSADQAMATEGPTVFAHSPAALPIDFFDPPEVP